MSGILKNLQEAINVSLQVKKDCQGEDREKKYRPYREGLARPRRCGRSCSPPWSGWAGWRSW